MVGMFGLTTLFPLDDVTRPGFQNHGMTIGTTHEISREWDEAASGWGRVEFRIGDFGLIRNGEYVDERMEKWSGGVME